MAFTVESRVSLIGVGAALGGSLIGSWAGVWGTYAKFADDRKVQIQANRNHAYASLKGQQAESLMLFQGVALAHDKNTFYQVRAAQQVMEGNSRRKALAMVGVNNLKETYLADALQQERNAEHYQDELIACSQKMFESIGLTQRSFSRDAALDEKIAAAESVLTKIEDIFPQETMASRFVWAATAEDAEEQISARQKNKT